MSTLAIELRTDIAPSQVSYAEVIVMDRNDSTQNQIIINANLSGNDYTSGVSIAMFKGLKDNYEYYVVFKLISNTGHILGGIQAAISRTAEPDCPPWWQFWNSCQGGIAENIFVIST
ncbi:MAG: hypothetical protein KAG10_02645 [Methylococcales bacterium]|nr:hypothetical protein [Methylococcales bacterium]MCK5924771.1 hypothetical protein [Methylococcales bacterium]